MTTPFPVAGDRAEPSCPDGGILRGGRARRQRCERGATRRRLVARTAMVPQDASACELALRSHVPDLWTPIPRGRSEPGPALSRTFRKDGDQASVYGRTWIPGREQAGPSPVSRERPLQHRPPRRLRLRETALAPAPRPPPDGPATPDSAAAEDRGATAHCSGSGHRHRQSPRRLMQRAQLLIDIDGSKIVGLERGRMQLPSPLLPDSAVDFGPGFEQAPLGLP